MATRHIAAIVGLALVASAGLAAATFEGRSIWGGNNPGQGGAHAAMPDAAAEHNRAGANHPTPDVNHTDDANETGEGQGGPSHEGNETDDGNETGDEAGGQPDDVPPAHAQDGEPEHGKPADVPPPHSAADEHQPPA